MHVQACGGHHDRTFLPGFSSRYTNSGETIPLGLSKAHSHGVEMAIKPTQSYSRYKDQTEALMDFEVLVAYAVPALRAEIQNVQSGQKSSLVRPDFFLQKQPEFTC